MSQSITLSMPAPRKRPAARRLLTLLALLLFTGCVLLYWLLTGRVEALQGMMQGDLAPIVAPMTAQVVEVLAVDGQMVRAGQPLLRLEGGQYRRQEAEALSLTRGARAAPALPAAPTPEETAARVADAQAAEEYTVRRVALARHEEEAGRRQLEQSVMEHVRAELQMRSLDSGHAPAQMRENARKAELAARQRKDEARAAFEGASRSRAAVENELQRVRRELEVARSGRGRATADAATGRPAQFVGDPTVLAAPFEGRLVGRVPQPGQMLARGETILRLAPADGAGLWAVAWISPAQAQSVRPGQLCFLRPDGLSGVQLRGEVHALTPASAPNAPAAPASPATAGAAGTPGAELTPVGIRLLDTPDGEMAARLPGMALQVVIWTRALPGLRHAAPLLAWAS